MNINGRCLAGKVHVKFHKNRSFPSNKSGIPMGLHGPQINFISTIVVGSNTIYPPNFTKIDQFDRCYKNGVPARGAQRLQTLKQILIHI